MATQRTNRILILQSTMQTLVVATVMAAVATLLNLTAAAHAATQAACTAPAKTLTFQCDNQCGAMIPCLARTTTTTDGTDACSIKCLDKVYGDEVYGVGQSFVIYTTSTALNSAEENVRVAKATKAPGELEQRQSETNDNLQAIERLELPPTVIRVYARSPSCVALGVVAEALRRFRSCRWLVRSLGGTRTWRT